MEKLITSRDEIKSFTPPSGNIRFVILGTMGSINARRIDGEKERDSPFFYHNNRNHFWRILHLVLEDKEKPKVFSVDDKMDLLNKHGIAMANIVSKIKVSKSEALKPHDEFLFKAYENKQLEFKIEDENFKGILRSKPLFFTCKDRKEIRELLEGYFAENNLDIRLREKVWHLITPTRGGYKKKVPLWRQEIENHLKTF